MSSIEMNPIIRAYNKECVGCVKNSSDIMLSVEIKKKSSPPDFLDLFLNNGDAVDLYNELGDRINQNLSDKETMFKWNEEKIENEKIIVDKIKVKLKNFKELSDDIQLKFLLDNRDSMKRLYESAMIECTSETLRKWEYIKKNCSDNVKAKFKLVYM